MTLTEHEQRILDQISGAELDKRAPVAIEHATLLSLNDRERDTVLAALGAWKHIAEGTLTAQNHVPLWDRAYSRGPALSPVEIDTIIGRITERLAK